MCFVNRKEKKEDNDLIEFSLIMNITRSPDILPDIISILKPSNSIISATYSPFHSQLLTDTISDISIPIPTNNTFTSDDVPFFHHDSSPILQLSQHTVKWSDILILENNVQLMNAN